MNDNATKITGVIMAETGTPQDVAISLARGIVAQYGE